MYVQNDDSVQHEFRDNYIYKIIPFYLLFTIIHFKNNILRTL